MATQTTKTPQNIVELIHSVNIQVSGDSQFRRFQRLYRDDRIAFVYDVFPDYRNTLAYYQEEILGNFDEGYDRVAVRGPHGLGKTFIAAALTHHTLLTTETDTKIPTTASAWRQLEKYLWPEIHKLSKAIDWTVVGRNPYIRKDELLTQSIRLEGGTVEAFAVASDDFTTIEGAHATMLVYIFDEAKTIPRQTWNAAEGAFSSAGLSNKVVNVKDRAPTYIIKKQPGLYIGEATPVEPKISTVEDSSIQDGVLLGSYKSGGGRGFDPVPHAAYTHQLAPSNGGAPSIQRTPIVSLDKQPLTSSSSDISRALAFAISTPGEPNGQFYDIHMRRPGYEDWLTRHVTVEEAIRAGRISAKWVKQRARQWGTDSSIYLNRVEGEFADTSEEGVIPLSWVRLAIDRWNDWWNSGAIEPSGKKVLGVDVARMGEDKTVMARRAHWVISGLYVYSKLPTTSTAGFVRSLGVGRYIHIEIDGIGASVYDILKEPPNTMPLLRPITVRASTSWRDRSGELGFYDVRSAMWWHMRELLDPDNGEAICLPPIEELKLDLTTPRWDMMKEAIIKVEDKKKILERLGRSTDYGDAVCLAFWVQSGGGGVVF